MTCAPSVDITHVELANESHYERRATGFESILVSHRNLSGCGQARASMENPFVSTAFSVYQQLRSFKRVQYEITRIQETQHLSFYCFQQDPTNTDDS